MSNRVTAAILAALLSLILAGCATMAERVGIASSETVDQKLTGTRNELEAQIAALRNELEAQQQRLSEIEDLSAGLEEAIRATEELERLAEIMETRLAQMPRDTIAELVTILERYLEENE
jgi:outer membrane murein-binding lipoprotein Lpp